MIGTRTKNVSVERALEHVFGYTWRRTSAIAICKNPRSNSAAANLSTPTLRWGLLFTRRSTLAILPITLRQNGEVKQKARTSQMIYSVAEIVSFASQSLTLLPGDLILTGTPSGVGPIRAGDELEARIGDWPPLRNSRCELAEQVKIDLSARNFLTLSYIPRWMTIRTRYSGSSDRTSK